MSLGIKKNCIVKMFMQFKVIYILNVIYIEMLLYFLQKRKNNILYFKWN